MVRFSLGSIAERLNESPTSVDEHQGRSPLGSRHRLIFVGSFHLIVLPRAPPHCQRRHPQSKPLRKHTSLCSTPQHFAKIPERSYTRWLSISLRRQHPNSTFLPLIPQSNPPLVPAQGPIRQMRTPSRLFPKGHSQPAKSNSEPKQESHPTLLRPQLARHSAGSKFDLSRCENSIPTIKFCSSPASIVPSLKLSPLCKEIVPEIEEFDPLPASDRAGSSKAISEPNGKEPHDLKPRPATQVKSKNEKPSIQIGDSSEKQILHRGIVAHQKNDMTLSAILFERCAKENGGSGVGMLMLEQPGDSYETQVKLKTEKPSIQIGDSYEKQILHMGIVAHQKNDMTLSAILFERCAKENGGSGVGMLMWALALRHGWGCPVNTLKALGWLQLSVETLLSELHHAKLEKQHYDDHHSLQNTPKDPLLDQYLINEINGIKSELLLALYELGQCLMYGWGCHRNKYLVNPSWHLSFSKLTNTPHTNSYNQLALFTQKRRYNITTWQRISATQTRRKLAYCYEVGNGVKRSSRNAAKYYRMACAQGIKMMGYQWIWKAKVCHDFQKFDKSLN
ncbi:hypothetical protein VP01_1852g2 [Puccinia sorghi]|uniref:Uncharacterized protein n=1 Tax=Puccinia sorghi TaxID=27349 RepID=A0A0L6VFF0_9BASI|nr:hypothetical protein VP01_1852g2 [Puccinia sorghi]